MLNVIVGSWDKQLEIFICIYPYLVAHKQKVKLSFNNIAF